MNILITGGTGFVGEQLRLHLIRQGHSLSFLTRSPEKNKSRLGGAHKYFYWDATASEPPAKAFDGIDAIINLMGEGVAEKRWSETQKQKIYDSRIVGTRYLVEGAKKHAKSLKTFISASAIGYYDHTKPGPLTVQSDPANDFMGKLCQDWEKEAKAISQITDVREVHVRIGVVIGNGGALEKMVLPFSLGLGGKLGSGKQWMNWIHVHDLVRILTIALEDDSYHGVYNAVSPENVTNEEFTQTLGKALKRFTAFSVPKFALRLLLGEMAIVVLQGQEIRPSRLLDAGFNFEYKNLDAALAEALGMKFIQHLNKVVRCRRLHVTQFIDRAPEDIFDFFSDAKNLEHITPTFLNFKITRQTTEKIQQDTEFEYRLRIRGISIRWVTLILDWNPIHSFVDTQLKGPYKVWHHTHRFVPYQGGTMIEDEVFYALPQIPVGTQLVQSFVDKDVRGIFEFRKKKITELFTSKK